MCFGPESGTVERRHGTLSPRQSTPPCPVPSALTPPASLHGFPLGPLGTVWVPWAFCTDACSHVPHLVSGGDYGIGYPKSDYKSGNTFGASGDVFHSVQGEQNDDETHK